MASLTETIAKFDKLAVRERVLAVLAAAAVLYFVLDIVLLTPQDKKLKLLHQLDQAHLVEADGLNKALAEIASNPSKAIDMQAQERTKLDELQKQIAEADAFLGQNTGTGAQLGSLVHALQDTNSGLTLVSLKTLPIMAIEGTAPKSGDKSKEGKDKLTATQKTLYRQGVEIGVSGTYPALLAYLRTLESNSKRLFWSGAKLNVDHYPNAVLTVTIYTVSDQADAALR